MKRDIHLGRAQAVGVLPQSAAQHRQAYSRGLAGIEPPQMGDHIFGRAGDEDFCRGREKLFDADPGIGDHAGTGASGLKHPRGR